MTQRSISSTLKTSLTDNDPFIYYHLVKFEKPKPSGKEGAIAGIATDYAYITDAPYNVDWDDASVDAEGNSNGTQTYIANKLLSIGGVQETVEARATTMSLKLSTLALGTVVTSSAKAFAGTFIEGNIDFALAGFREGDKVLLEVESASGNDSKYVRLDRLALSATSALPNSRIYYTDIDSTVSNDSIAYDYTFTLVSEELSVLTLGKNETLFSNYINREVYIYRVHGHPITGVIIGAPFLLFRGIISQGSIQEDPEKGSTIIWGLTSHWGDFVRIQGRITSDSAHRALSLTGRPDADALVRPEYASDYGFMHAERSVNVLGVYQVQELRFKTKKRGGLAGFLGGKKVVEFFETVDREVDLRFNLSALYLPVVYGVQKVSSIPVFADIDAADPKFLYVVYALCEGEIGGIYDIHVENNPSVCSDANDEVLRGTAAAAIEDNNVEVVCFGRADRGDVLAGANYTAGAPLNIGFRNTTDEVFRFLQDSGGFFSGFPIGDNFGTAQNAPNPSGLTHETTYTFEIPINANFVIHTGKPDQRADEVFVAKALDIGFKIQADYFEGDPSNYWSTSHRLLDTAYVGCKFTLSEGEESIPQYEFIIKGKYIECRNYDHSFKHDPDSSFSAESADNFDLGDSVNIQTFDGTWSTVHTAVQVIDKWIIYDKQGNIDTRFRWATGYPLAGNKLVNIGSDTQVRMTGGGNNWTMVTHDHVAQTGNVTASPIAEAEEVAATAVNYTQDSAGNGTLVLRLENTPIGSGVAAISTILNQAINTDSLDKVFISITTDPTYAFLVTAFDNTTKFITLGAFSGAAAVLQAQDYTGNNVKVFISNLVDVPSVTDLTVGDSIIVNRTTSGVIATRTKIIAGISSTYVFTESPFDENFVPSINTSTWAALGTPDTFSAGSGNDERVSVNPAMQTLDYITSRRYGRDLSYETDLNSATFLESGRLCDDQSKVVVVATNQPSVGAVYSYTRAADSSLAFQGTVDSVTTRVFSGTKYEVTFDDVIGKLGYKWNDWRTYKTDDLIWGAGDAVSKATSNGTIPLESTFIALADEGSVSLVKVSGSGPATLTVSVARLGGLKNTNPIVRSWNPDDAAFTSPGYSLYDSDNVKYWKYLGWDEPEQRYVTRHQMNHVVNTNTPIFDNLNSMLVQFNGMLRYSNGKYELDIMTASPSSFVVGIDSISENDIVGTIKLDDKGQKKSYNSITANIIDPQNKFGARSISFFNSNYLKEDRGIPKQGNFSMPAVSNFYNARLNIVQFLDESRYGLTISFIMDPKGYLLLPGKIIVINYTRFNWVDKEFRVKTMTLQPNGSVAIVAREHNNNAFLIDFSDRSAIDGIGDGTGDPGLSFLPSPTNLAASQLFRGEIELTWTNASTYNVNRQDIEIHAVQADKDSAGNYTTDSAENFEGNIFANASLLDKTDGSNYVHDGLGPDALHVWFYWIRYVKPPNLRTDVAKFSRYEPLSSGLGVEGQGLSSLGLDAFTMILSNEAHTFPGDSLGNVTDYTGSGTNIQLLEGSVELVYDGVGTADGTWTINPDPPVDTNITAGPITDPSAFVYAVVGDHSAMTSQAAQISYTINGRRGGGETIPAITKDQTFSVSSAGDDGSAGLDAKTVKLTASDYIIIYDENEINPIPDEATDILLTGTASGIATPWFKFTGEGFVDQTVFSATSTFTWPVPASYFSAPRTVRVGVSDGDQSELAFDTITIAAVHPGTDGSVGVNGRVVNLSAVTLAFTYSTAGDVPIPTTALVTATDHNTSGTPWYNFILNDVGQQNTTGNTWTYTAQALLTNMPDKVEVELREDGAGNPVLARDQIAMVGLKDGSSAISAVLSNSAHTLATTNLGVVTYTGSGTDISVYEGDTILDYDGIGTADGTWRVDTIVDTNITAGSLVESSSGQFVSVNDHSAMTADQASIAYEMRGIRADGTAFVIEKIQSFSKSTEGDAGSVGADGEDGILIHQTNASHSIPTDENGNNADYTGSGNIISVFEGNTELAYDGVGSADGTWDIGTIIDTDITVGTTTDSGNFVTQGVVSAMTGGTGTKVAIIDYPISGTRLDGSAFGPITLTQTFSKSIKGDVGDQGAAGGTGLVRLIGGFFSHNSTTNPTVMGYHLVSGSPAFEQIKRNTDANETIGTWVLSGNPTDYDVMVSLEPGSSALTSGSAATDSWLDMVTARFWAVEDTTTTGGSNISKIHVKLRLNSTGEILASTVVTLEANRDV